MPTRSEEFATDATALGARGEAIGRDARNRRVFITGAIPGERVRAAVLTERPTYVRARLIGVLDPSPHRTDPPCPEVARGCGGCQWQHVSVAGQRAVKQAAIEAALARACRGDAPLLQPCIDLPEVDYRTSLRAAVSGDRAGYRRARQHSVVTPETCAVAHPLIEELLVHGRFPGAEEVILRCGARTGERLAVPSPADAETIVPADVRRDHIHEVAAGRRWRISAQSFFQSRPDGADALAALVAAAAGRPGAGSRAVDLYSGVGLFAGVLVDAGWTVSAVESSAGSVADANVNLAGAPVNVFLADVHRWRGGRADLVVADPARRGLGDDGVATVLSTGARRVVLVSCDLDALGRDTALLGRAGYALTSATPVDLFPHTFHIEVVSTFDR
jgi:23S rRNA (uracil1939-C5)-methyltransferase